MKQFLTALACLFLAVGAHAQLATTTALVGTITDSSGKSMAGVKITAVNAGTLDTYTTTTNEDGNYRIDFVRVGTYNVTAEQAGFSRVQHTGSIVDNNQVVRNDFTLTPGAVSESITIAASA